MSEEAERQYQQNKLQTDSIVQTDQPETVSSSFVTINFEMEEDCEAIKENKQRPVSVPPQNEMTVYKVLHPKLLQSGAFYVFSELKTTIYTLNYYGKTFLHSYAVSITVRSEFGVLLSQ